MKKPLAILVAAIAIAANASTLTLSPGLSAPVGGDGAIVEAAVLVSTNEAAEATLNAIYDIPLYGDVEYVVTNVADVLTCVTNSVVVTNYSPSVTSNYFVTTAYGLVTTNYYTVATNSIPSWVAMPGTPTISTNTVREITGYASVTNDFAHFEMGGGPGPVFPFESNPGYFYPLAPGARILFECDADPAATITIFLR